MTPTQADREAAADYLTQCGDGLRAFNVRSGNVEECFGVSPLVQAFTRHRLAAEAAAFEKAAGVARQYAQQVEALMADGDCDDDTLSFGAGRGVAATNIETAIRKLAGEKHD